MDQILEIREAVIGNFKKYETFIVPFAKFIIGFITFYLINKIGLYSPIFSSVFGGGLKILLSLMLAFAFVCLPMSINYGIIVVNIALQLSNSIEICIVASTVLFLIYLFYGRLGLRESSLILATVLCFYFKIPYVVPMIAGLYFGITAFIPIILGTFIWHMGPTAINLAKSYEVSEDIFERITGFSKVMAEAMDLLKGDMGWVIVGFIFTIVFIVVYVISKVTINYNKVISIVAATFSTIFLFIFLGIGTGLTFNIVSTIVFSLISGLIVYIISLFDAVLDYDKVEKVEFEDEENHYYVKVVPKINIKKKAVRKQPQNMPRPNKNTAPTTAGKYFEEKNNNSEDGRYID